MGEKTIQSILVVDDDAVCRKKLCRIFQRLGFEQVKEAEQGDEALKMLKEQPVDLVMADWHMPGLNGLELLKAIRAEESLQAIHLYLVTAEARQGQIVAAIQAGATGYIMKPFSQESIKQKLGKLIPSELQPVESNTDRQGDENQTTEAPGQQEVPSDQDTQAATVG